MDSAHNNKHSLRAQCLAKRQRIAPEAAKAASLEIAKRLVSFIPASAAIVAGYRAVRGEIDVFEAMAQLSERGHALCLPVVLTSPSPPVGEGRGGGAGSAYSISNPWRDPPLPNPPPQGGRGRFLSFRRWRIGHPLELGQYGIEIPPASEPEFIPDVVLVPLVAFDAGGHRLGYGGGFYDAAIHGLRESGKPVHIIGVAFGAQQVEQLPAEPHDEKLDAVVTEKGIVGA